MEVSGEDQGDTPGELQAGVGVLDSLDGLHDRGGDPAGVGKDEGKEQIGMDFISQTSHFPRQILLARVDSNTELKFT